MLTIAHVISGLELGGAETMLLKLMTNMDNTQYKSIVISLSTEGYYGEIMVYRCIR